MIISIAVKASTRRHRSTTLRIVNRGELELLIPQKFGLSLISQFLIANIPFLRKSMSIPFIQKTRKSFEVGDIVSLLGTSYLLEKGSIRSLPQIRGEKVLLPFRTTTLTRKRFYELATNFLKAYCEKRIAELSDEMRLYPKRVRYKLVKSLWGSCSTRGGITLNKKLVHYPPATIDYVIIHELAHLQEHNHSKRFWDLVAKHCPDFQKHRKILKEKQFN